MINHPPTKPETVSTLLARAEVLARQTGDDELASKILNLRLFGDGDAYTDIPAAPERPDWIIPGGKYAGQTIGDLNDAQLREFVDEEIDRRAGKYLGIALQPADDTPPFDPPYSVPASASDEVASMKLASRMSQHWTWSS